MAETGNDRESDQFETALVQQQAQRRTVIRLLGAAAAALGLAALGYAAFVWLGDRGPFVSALISAALGLAGLGAGGSMLFRSRPGADDESDAFDDFLSRTTPRILGGQKVEKLDEHDRRRRRRRR